MKLSYCNLFSIAYHTDVILFQVIVIDKNANMLFPHLTIDGISKRLRGLQ